MCVGEGGESDDRKRRPMSRRRTRADDSDGAGHCRPSLTREMYSSDITRAPACVRPNTRVALLGTTIRCSYVSNGDVGCIN